MQMIPVPGFTMPSVFQMKNQRLTEKKQKNRAHRNNSKEELRNSSILVRVGMPAVIDKLNVLWFAISIMMM